MDGNVPDGGMTTIEYLTATALSLLALVILVNVVLIFYARGVVRSALDEGVRAGTPSRLSRGEAVAACDRKVHEVLGGLLSGPLGSDVHVTCAIDADGYVRASADARFDPWIPGTMPVWTFHPRASAKQDD
ncbi:MAG: hypothetical protein U0V73_16625 [Acidimicrobiia bacterium]